MQQKHFVSFCFLLAPPGGISRHNITRGSLQALGACQRPVSRYLCPSMRNRPVGAINAFWRGDLEAQEGRCCGRGGEHRESKMADAYQRGAQPGAETKKNRPCGRFFPKIIRRLLCRSGFSRLCISGRSGSVSRLCVSSRSSGVSRLGSVSSRSGVSRLCISSRSSSGRSFSSRSSCGCRSFFLLAASSQGNSQQRSDQQSLFHEYSFSI